MSGISGEWMPFQKYHLSELGALNDSVLPTDPSMNS